MTPTSIHQQLLATFKPKADISTPARFAKVYAAFINELRLTEYSHGVRFQIRTAEMLMRAVGTHSTFIQRETLAIARSDEDIVGVFRQFVYKGVMSGLTTKACRLPAEKQNAFPVLRYLTNHLTLALIFREYIRALNYGLAVSEETFEHMFRVAWHDYFHYSVQAPMFLDNEFLTMITELQAIPEAELPLIIDEAAACTLGDHYYTHLTTEPDQRKRQASVVWGRAVSTAHVFLREYAEVKAGIGGHLPLTLWSTRFQMELIAELRRQATDPVLHEIAEFAEATYEEYSNSRKMLQVPAMVQRMLDFVEQMPWDIQRNELFLATLECWFRFASNLFRLHEFRE